MGLRRRRKLGPARIAAQLEVPASMVHRVLVRHGLIRLNWMDRHRHPVRRCEHANPGDLVHVDIKKLAKVCLPAAGGGSTAAAPRLAARRQRRCAAELGPGGEQQPSTDLVMPDGG